MFTSEQIQICTKYLQKIVDQIFFISWRRHGETIGIAGARRMGTGGCPGLGREGYDSYLKHLNFSFRKKRCEWKFKTKCEILKLIQVIVSISDNNNIVKVINAITWKCSMR